MHRVHSFTLAAALAAAFTTGTAAHVHAQQPAATASANQDTEFVQKAAAVGRMEVEHGKLAASQASNAQVKAFGNTLVKDHTAANQQLTTIAKRKNIEIAVPSPAARNSRPAAGGSADTTTADTKSGAKRTPVSGTTGTTGASGGVATTGEARDRQRGAGQPSEPWMSATGVAFDRGFVDAQVKAHQEAIALFEKEATGGADTELKAFAQKQLPGLRNHLKQAQDLQAKLSTSTSFR